MSAFDVAVEACVIAGAAVAIVAATAPAEDLVAWWEEQEWLQRLIMPARAPRDLAPEDPGLAIFPWVGDETGARSARVVQGEIVESPPEARRTG